MATGDRIDYSHITSIVGGSWIASATISGGNASGVFYFCASSFVLRFDTQTAGLFAKATLTGKCEYYNGSSWVTAFSQTASTSGLGGNDSKKVYHNRSAEGTTSGDNLNYHLWRVTLSQSYSGSNHSIYFMYYLGGIPLAGETYYNNYCKNNLIKYCSPTWVGKVDASSFLTNYRPSHFRGNQITNALAKAVSATLLD